MLPRFSRQTNFSDTYPKIPDLAYLMDCLSGYCKFRIGPGQYYFPTQENRPV